MSDLSDRPAVEPRLRELPHSNDAEQALLGALLLDGAAFERIADVVAGADFYRHEHRMIFEAIEAIVRRGEPVDVLTVSEQLEGETADCGGLLYLTELAQSTPNASHARRYAEIVRNLARRRELIAVSDAIAAEASSTGGHAVDSLITSAVERVSEIRHTPTAPRRVAPLDLRGLATRRAPEREWTIDQWKPRNVPMLLAGSGGAGKSLLAQQTATAEALRRDFIGGMFRQARVLVWNCEDDADELWRRQEAICDFYGVDLDAAEGLFLVSRFKHDNVLMGPTRSGSLSVTKVFKELREQVNDLMIDSLWLDNVAHLFAGNHNDNGEVTVFVNTICGLVMDRPLDVASVAHTARQQGSEFSGSAAWENACRARWYFGSKLPDQKDGDEPADPNVRYLARRKANYAAANDHMRMTYRGGAFVPDQPAGRVGGLVRALDEQKADEIVVAGFRSLLTMGVPPTDGKTSPDYLPRQLAEKGLSAGYTVPELARAMNRLMGRGVFVRGVVGRYSNRGEKMGLVLVEGGSA